MTHAFNCAIIAGNLLFTEELYKLVGGNPPQLRLCLSLATMIGGTNCCDLIYVHGGRYVAGGISIKKCSDNDITEAIVDISICGATIARDSVEDSLVYLLNKRMNSSVVIIVKLGRTDIIERINWKGGEIFFICMQVAAQSNVSALEYFLNLEWANKFDLSRLYYEANDHHYIPAMALLASSNIPIPADIRDNVLSAIQ